MPMDVRGISRIISCADFIFSFGITIFSAIMAARVSIQDWNWKLLKSGRGLVAINSSSVSTTFHDGHPKAFSLFSGVKNDVDLMIKWLSFIVIFLLFTIRTSAAIALFKGTAKNKDAKTAIVQCAFWITTNIFCLIFLGWLAHERFQGTFAGTNPISLFDYYSYWIFCISQGVPTIVVCAFTGNLRIH